MEHGKGFSGRFIPISRPPFLNLLSMDINIFLKELTDQWYATIPYTISRDQFQKCINTFRAFIRETPLSVRESVDVRHDPAQRFSLGFRDKSTSEGFDEKCYFHYNHHIQDHDFLSENRSYQEFISAMDSIYRELDILVHEIFDGLIALGYAESESLYNESWETNSNARILQYRPKESCEYLAKPHTDRGIFTLTLFETDPWLRFYLPDTSILPIQYEEFTLKMFPTDYWNTYISYPLIPMTHDVIKESGNRERGSIVLFVNPAFGKWPFTEETLSESPY